MALNTKRGKTASKLKQSAPKPRQRPFKRVKADADAELIQLCREFDALERRILVGTLNIDTVSGRDRITTPLYRQQDRLIERIRGIAPQTLAGCKAVASTLSLWTRFLGQKGIDRDLLEMLLGGLAKLKD